MKVAAVIVGYNHWHHLGASDGNWTRSFAHELQARNKDMKVLVYDNDSSPPYQSDVLEIIHCKPRISYAAALNSGIHHLRPGNYDWYITLNNDCQMCGNGDVMSVMRTLDENVLYGSGWNVDNRLHINWQFSAWLCISKKVLQKVGMFDEGCAAAFEDFDYERRAEQAGFRLDTAPLPIEHLAMHTRYEDRRYPAKWEDARLYFNQKHGLNLAGWYTDEQIREARNG